MIDQPQQKDQPMDESFFRLLGGLSGSGVDLSLIFAFVAFGIVYFLAPVVGYTRSSPGMTFALYLLIAAAAMPLLQSGLRTLMVMDGTGGMQPGRGQSELTTMLMLFHLLKLALFVAAMVAFVAGLGQLKRRDDVASPPGGGTRMT